MPQSWDVVGFRAQGSGVRVWGFGFRVWGLVIHNLLVEV